VNDWSNGKHDDPLIADHRNFYKIEKMEQRQPARATPVGAVRASASHRCHGDCPRQESAAPKGSARKSPAKKSAAKSPAKKAAARKAPPRKKASGE